VSSQLQQIQSSLDSPVSVGESVLNQMVDEELIRQEAASRGITVSAAELESGIRANFDFYPNGTPTMTITPTTVVSPTVPPAAFAIVSVTPTLFPTLVAAPTLSEVSTDVTPSPLPLPAAATVTATATSGPTTTAVPTATPLTEAGFQERFDKTLGDLSRMGFGETDFRKFMETQLLREKLFEVLTADVSTVQAQVWARHVLVEEEVVAAALRDRLSNGEDFATLAREASKDPASGVNGGDLGWFAHGVMVDAFEQVAFSLEPGEISAPVKSDFGWHIIQVIARQNRPYTHDEYQRARQDAFQEWLTQAREGYGVATFDSWKDRVPTEPSFASVATEAVYSGQTALAEENRRTAATGTPAPP
jgi:hypothetical protein